MKTIKYTILFLTFVVTLYYSQSVTILAPIIWNLLYGNSQLYSFSFFLITIIYLLFIYSYFNLLNINRKLSKVLLNKLFFYSLFQKLVIIFYDFYYYLFKVIQPIQVFIKVKLTNSSFIFNTFKNSRNFNSFNFRLSRYASFFKYDLSDLSDLIFGTNLKNYNYTLLERKFIANLIKKAYTYSLTIRYCNRFYTLTLAEVIELFYRIEFKFNSNNFKLLKNFIKLLKLLRETQDVFVYSDLVGFDRWKEFYGYEDLPKKKVRKLFTEDHRTADRKSNYRIKKFLKLMDYNPIKYRLFILLCLNKYFTDINSFLAKKPFFISIDPNFLNKTSYYYNIFCKMEYNLYYLYKKELDLNKFYYNVLLSRFFKEIKIMFQFIKYFILFYFLTFIISPIFINYFIIIFIILSFMLQYLTLKTYSQIQMFKYRIFRIIYFKIFYSCNLFVLTNSLYLILINYLILTLLLILVFSLFEAFYHIFTNNSDFTLKNLIIDLIKEIIYFNRIYFYFFIKYNLLKRYKYYYKVSMKYYSYKNVLIKFLNKN